MARFASTLALALCVLSATFAMAQTTTTTASASNSTTNATSTSVTTTTAPVTVYTAQGTFRLSGGAWAELLNNTARTATLIASLQTDIAALLGIDPTYVVILHLSVGSLIIDFAVLSGSNKTAAQLISSAQTAESSTSWLSTTKSVYALVSNETITVLSVSTVVVAGGTTGAAVVITTPPTTTTSSNSSSTTTTTTSGTVTTPAPSGTSSPSSASSVSLVAAVAVAFGAVVLAL